MQTPTRYSLEVNPRIPKRLARLEEIAANLYYSWDRPTRALFAKLNPALWSAVGHSPKAMLKRIDEQRLIDAAADPAFLDSLTRVLGAFDAYHAEPPFKQNSGGFRPGDLVAYFCAEFGVHESLPTYSGGLGILAGDHCKAASDFQLPFVAVGLLYRQGYFVQTIDADGRQRAEYHDSDFDDLPIAPVRRQDGSDLTIDIQFPGRKVLVKVWQARVGHVTIYLLDTDLPENNERDRDIAHRLYGGDFNMTALAIRGSRYQNGVSRIHGGVSARLLHDYWPQVAPDENPLGYVTNGVHVATFLAPEWSEVLDRFLGVGWMHRLGHPGIWEKIRAIPDHIFWSVRQDIKARLFHMVRHRVALNHARNHGSESHLQRLLKYADPANPNVLTIGFGRRFATYKRATLLFNDLENLRRLLADRSRQVLFLFAGKAHPADEPGQELIRTLAHMSRQEEFAGRILFLEGYDLHIARRLVSGVDVWLNNPVHPLEASGTSGMKAGMNGVINLSILDGWWDEGYDGENGWAIKPASPEMDPHRRDQEEARTLYEILQDRVMPLYYDRTEGGYSPGWVRIAKRSMASLLPRYDASRMLGEYVSKYYIPASRQGHRYSENSYEAAKTVSAWKAKIRSAWSGVSARRIDSPKVRIQFGEAIPVEVAVKLNGLAPNDVCVELLLTRSAREGSPVQHSHELSDAGDMGHGEHRYRVEMKPGLAGRLDYRIRVFPRHDLLTHPFELGLCTWV